jgi:hypothetical protein
LKRLLDYDHLTEVQTWFEHDELTDVTTISQVQDVEPFLEVAKILRNDDGYTREGMKKSFVHFAILPIMIQQKMMTEDGIDPLKTEHQQAAFKLIQEKYPAFKVTNIRHRPKG